MRLFRFIAKLFKTRSSRPSATVETKNARYRKLLDTVGRELCYGKYRKLDTLGISRKCRVGSSFVKALVELKAVEQIGVRGSFRYKLLDNLDNVNPADVRAKLTELTNRRHAEKRRALTESQP